MTLPLIIVVLTLFLMLICIIFDFKLNIKNFSISIYWIVCLIGAIICISCGFIKFESFKEIFISSASINPIKILILFLSCTSLSVLLDKIGFFKYIAQLTLQKAKSSQTKLFFVFSLIISVLTIFTSNDILILTFTPFICYFTKRANIDPTPYIVSEFICANTWSMFFFIGNPTNIYLSTLYNITFIYYLIKMVLPTIVAVIVSFIVMYLLFRKKLKKPITYEDEEVIKPNKIFLIISLIGLCSMIIMMIISPYLGLDIWYIPLICAVITYVATLIYALIKKEKLIIFKDSLKSLPYEIIPFLISMAVLVLTLENIGFSKLFGEFISNQHIIVVGIIAFLIGNLINNIPMTMFFASVLGTFTANYNMVYSVIVASNICAFLTPVGALAGIMFMKILKENNINFNFAKFMLYGLIISIPTLISSLSILLI